MSKTSLVVQAATDTRLLKRSCESLLGICAGLVADGNLNDTEIVFLRTWLAEHDSLGRTWPGEVVLRRVEQVLHDGVVTEEERLYLIKTLHELLGGSFVDDGAIPSGSCSLPVDTDAEISIAGKSFCFTGQFLFGTRAACERAVEQRGGSISGVRKSLAFLVIGELSSRDWKNSSFGLKISSAVDLRASGCPLLIVSEGQWVRALGLGTS